MLTYGITTGLNYKHNTLDWENQRNQQEQLNKQDEQMRMQKANWLSDQMTLGKTFTDYDRTQLTNDAQNRILPEIANLMKQPGAYSNPNILAQVKMLGEQLKDNKWVQNSTRWNQQREMLTKALSDPELANDPDARVALMEQLEQANNYNRTGNKMGIEGGEVDEYFYQQPKVFDFNSFANDQSKFLGTREVFNDIGNGIVKTSEVFANLNEMTNTLLNGKHANDLNKQWEKSKNSSHFKDKYSWLKHELEIRHSLNSGLQQFSDQSAKSGDGGGLSDAFDYATNITLNSFAEAIDNSNKQGGKPFSIFPANDDNWRYAQGVSIDQRDGMMYAVPTNANVVVPKADGSVVALKSLSGQQYKISNSTEFVARNGSIYMKTFMHIPTDEDKNPEINKLLGGEGYIWDDWQENKDIPGMKVNTVDGGDNFEGVTLPVEIPVKFNDMAARQQDNISNTGVSTSTKAVANNSNNQSLVNQALRMGVGEVKVFGGVSYKRIGDNAWLDMRPASQGGGTTIKMK